MRQSMDEARRCWGRHSFLPSAPDYRACHPLQRWRHPSEPDPVANRAWCGGCSEGMLSSPISFSKLKTHLLLGVSVSTYMTPTTTAAVTFRLQTNARDEGAERKKWGPQHPCPLNQPWNCPTLDYSR